MNDPNQYATTQATNVPLYEQAQRQLDELSKTLSNRLATIEQEMQVLAHEREALVATLNRIAPPAPIPLAGSPIVGGIYTGNSSGSSWNR